MAQSLGDFFSKEIKEKLTELDVKLKGILLIKIPEFDVTYDKFAILVALSNCKGFIGMVAINTDKPFSGNCLTITKAQYPFLSYDSHVGCDFISDRPINEIKSYLLNNPQNIMGEITDFHHVQILQKLQVSKVVTPKQKKKFDLI